MSTKKIQIIGNLGAKIYTQNEEPQNADDGALWIDLDEVSTDESSGGAPRDAVLYTEQSLTKTQKAQARENIGVLEPLIGSTDNITPAQVSEAVRLGRDVVISHIDAVYGTIYFTGFLEVPALDSVESTGISPYYDGNQNVVMRFALIGGITEGDWVFWYERIADYSDIPSTLPNPNALTFNGAVTGTYDGSSATTITIPTPDVSGQINTHNTATDAHNDIRDLINGLTTRLNTLANSDDTTLDQMSEVVAYIKNNKTLIEGITTNKVNVSDIINNLTTNVSNKPLSAAQGVALKALIDAIVVPTKVSELTNDKGYITGYTETDPTVPSWAKASTKPSYTASEVGADAKGTASTAVTTHNTATDAHADIRAQVGTKVDKITGKGLSTNDYTNADKSKLDNTNVAYGTCSTDAAVAEKAVVLNGNTHWSLTNGSIIMVKFDVSNTAESVKINVNNTGAYPIWYNNAEYTSTGTAYTGYANRTITYMFNGTHYVWITASYDANSTYTNAALGQGYATCSTAAATAAKVGSLSSYKLLTGGIVAVKFTNAVPANATLNINSTGAKSIYFRGAKITADVIKAGDVATFVYSSYYHLISIDRWQNDITSMQNQISQLLSEEYKAEMVSAVIAALPDASEVSY